MLCIREDRWPPDTFSARNPGDTDRIRSRLSPSAGPRRRGVPRPAPSAGRGSRGAGAARRGRAWRPAALLVCQGEGGRATSRSERCQSDVQVLGFVRPDVEIAHDRPVARPHDLDPVRSGGDGDAPDLAARAAKYVVDVDGRVRRVHEYEYGVHSLLVAVEEGIAGVAIGITLVRARASPRSRH